MKQLKTIQEIRTAYDRVKSGCAGDTIFIAQAMLFLCEQAANRSHRSPRKPSAWQQFVAEGLRAGKPMQQIAAEWRQAPA